jgi:hypothetical protein
LCAVAAIGLWVVGQARYTEDYCQTRVDEPAAPAGVEGLSGRPAYLDGPVTIRCDYDQVPDLTVTDPLPLVGALVLIVLVLGVVAVTIQWARRPSTITSQRHRTLMPRVVRGPAGERVGYALVRWRQKRTASTCQPTVADRSNRTRRSIRRRSSRTRTKASRPSLLRTSASNSAA